MTQNPNTPAGGATEYHEKPALNADQPSNLAGAEGPYPAHREGLPAAAREARARGTQPTLGELVARISENVSGLVSGEIALAKAKAQAMGQKAGLGAGLLAAAGVLALYALGFLLSSASWGLAVVMPMWLAKLIVALVLLVICGVLALIGKKRLDAGLKDVPAPQEGLKHDVQTAKVAIKSGIEKGSDK